MKEYAIGFLAGVLTTFIVCALTVRPRKLSHLDAPVPYRIRPSVHRRPVGRRAHACRDHGR